ncbi:hypothetical protein ACFYKX_10540 [Cytobacillus sp. FJAT-54145]|uniref:Uncharacterized protein n=1 Tax=Cytobacillus spartinae TaxID=3299023 RepID=A0ABW6KCR3_9BACI
MGVASKVRFIGTDDVDAFLEPMNRETEYEIVKDNQHLYVLAPVGTKPEVLKNELRVVSKSDVEPWQE